MKQLEQIVQDLESEDLPLEKALKKFEEGVKLSKLCSDQLDDTEHKITLLLKDQAGDIVEKPFMDDTEDSMDDASSSETV